MLHFLITNRQVLTDAYGNEYIEEDGLDKAGEAEETIRFAVFDSAKYKASGNCRSSIKLFPQTDAKLIANEISIGNGDLLCYIHGFHTDLKGMLNDICSLEKKYIREGSPVQNLIAITWPARKNIWAYADDARDAELSGITFARSYPLLKDFFSTLCHNESTNEVKRNIHLLAHSMGNRMLLNMISHLTADNSFTPSVLFKEVILAAPDIDWHVFEDPYAFSKLCMLCHRVTVYHHEHDTALFFSERVKNKHKRLGRYGFRDYQKLPPNVYSVNCTDVMDEANLIENVIDHAYFQTSSYAINDIIQVLHGKSHEYFIQESLRSSYENNPCRFRIQIKTLHLNK